MKSLFSLLCCQDQMSYLHTRLLWFLANMGLLHVQHVLFYHGYNIHHAYKMHDAHASVMLELPQRAIMQSFRLPLGQPEQSGCWQWEAGISVLACAKSCAESVHVQRHTCHYLSFICFAEGGICSISSSACRRATPHPTLVIMQAHFGHTF